MELKANRSRFVFGRLIPVPAKYVKPPLIKECPVSIECRVTQAARPGGHEMFFGEMVAVHVDEDVLDEKRPESGRFRIVCRNLNKIM